MRPYQALEGLDTEPYWNKLLSNPSYRTLLQYDRYSRWLSKRHKLVVTCYTDRAGEAESWKFMIFRWNRKQAKLIRVHNVNTGIVKKLIDEWFARWMANEGWNYD